MSLTELPLFSSVLVCHCCVSLRYAEKIIIPNTACLSRMLLAGCPQFLQPQITQCENFCRSISLIRQVDARDQRGCQQCSCQRPGTKQDAKPKLEQSCSGHL